MSEELQRRRTRIDAIDDELLRLVSERAAHAAAIGGLKNGAVYRPEREAQILNRLRAQNPGPLSGDTVARLFREIMSACLALEQPLRVAYLGPEGTFSQAAAVKHFGHAAETISCGSIDEIFHRLEAGGAAYGVVPVENSSGGAVGVTLDLLVQSPLQICGEVNLRVHQCLLCKQDSLDEVRRIYSHAQSLAQCREWLNHNLPAAERVPVVSNTEAARLAAEDAGGAAIAGEIAGELYGLCTVARNIEDQADNTTRFLVMGTRDAAPSGRDKTSVAMSAKNRPGAVYALLEPLAQHRVSMTRMESRPSRTGLWEYVFFIDIEGHRQDEKVAQALAELTEKASFLRILGSYPVAAL
ncbi:MAG TPA: prephenate dehydratase [Betaproteobacteria bacterium]|nr:prephenate dehydratase [Betaproteobacteria bacterium]